MEASILTCMNCSGTANPSSLPATAAAPATAPCNKFRVDSLVSFYPPAVVLEFKQLPSQNPQDFALLLLAPTNANHFPDSSAAIDSGSLSSCSRRETPLSCSSTLIPAFRSTPRWHGCSEGRCRTCRHRPRRSGKASRRCGTLRYIVSPLLSACLETSQNEDTQYAKSAESVSAMVSVCAPPMKGRRSPMVTVGDCAIVRVNVWQNHLHKVVVKASCPCGSWRQPEVGEMWPAGMTMIIGVLCQPR